MLRRNRKPEPAPARALSPRWRRPVEQATRAQAHFAAIATGTPPGPTRERLDALAARLAAGVAAASAIAQRADTTEVTLDQLDVDEVGDRLKSARRRLAQSSEADPQRARYENDVAALAEQF